MDAKQKLFENMEKINSDFKLNEEYQEPVQIVVRVYDVGNNKLIDDYDNVGIALADAVEYAITDNTSIRVFLLGISQGGKVVLDETIMELDHNKLRSAQMKVDSMKS